MKLAILRIGLSKKELGVGEAEKVKEDNSYVDIFNKFNNIKNIPDDYLVEKF